MFCDYCERRQQALKWEPNCIYLWGHSSASQCPHTRQPCQMYDVSRRFANLCVLLSMGTNKECVRVGGKVSESFEVKMGLRQGCVMSPWLFNMFMDGVVREVYSRVNGMGVKMSVGGEEEWVLSQLLFADDTALVAESAEQLQCLVSEFERVCKQRKLRVNVNKSKVMSVEGNVEPSLLNVLLNGEIMEVVNSFKYL